MHGLYSILFRWNIVTALFIILLSCANEEPDCVPNTQLANYAKIHNESTPMPIGSDSIKILAIGNSFTNNSMELLPSILQEYNLNNITLGKVCHGGATLQEHEKFWRKESPVYNFQVKRPQDIGWSTNFPNFTISNAVQYENWDIIVLQQASALSGLYKKYQPYLNRLIEYILSECTNPDVVIIWHMTWPYSNKCKTRAFSAYKYNPSIMYDSIYNATKAVLKETNIRYIIPSGECIKTLRNSDINKNDTGFTDDGIHIDHSIGKYALAYTWFQSIIHPIYSHKLDSTTYFYKNSSIQLSTEELQLMQLIIQDIVNQYNIR